MKKYSLFIYIIPICVLVLFGFLYLKNSEVERYGVVLKSSTSGDMRFSYYDIKENKSLDSWEGYPWFFATIDDLNDTEKISSFYDYISENKNSVFKITGTKEKDDCEYFGKGENEGKCLENIKIEKIEVDEEKINPMSMVDCDFEPEFKYWYFEKENGIVMKNKRDYFITCRQEGTGHLLDAFVFKDHKQIYKSSLYRGDFYSDNEGNFYELSGVLKEKNTSNPSGYFLRKYRYNSKENILEEIESREYSSQEEI